MQPVMNRGSVFNEPDPPDVFCSLGSLIVEGRIPSNDDRGYGEGPHVPPPKTLAISRHECSKENYMCKRDENFRKHLLLLWQNNVPISIEVLLCSECLSGEKRTQSVEFTSIPEHGAILLEQWTVSIHSQSRSEHPINSRGLFQAVRSYLHFSQLSAWYSSTKGQEPKNVLYRITLPGENFSSKFSLKPVEHLFPPAFVGQSSCVHVTVRSLPRRQEIPKVLCCHLSPIAAESPTNSEPGCGSSSSLTPDKEERKLPMAGALAWKEPADHPETDLRKAIVKTRLAECSGLDRSDSMDSILGDSLLDPPQSLQKIPPERYQSPSRCGSPGLEAPDHLLFGHSVASRNKESGPDMFLTGSARRARQDLLRRRDLNLYCGLHPRLLDGRSQASGKPKGSDNPRPIGPFRAYPYEDPRSRQAAEESNRQEQEKLDEDCSLCSQSDMRKAPFPYGADWSLCDPEDFLQLDDQGKLGAKSKKKNRDSGFGLGSETDADEEGVEVEEYPTSKGPQPPLDAFQKEMQEILASLSPKGSACSSRRSSLKEDEALFSNFHKKKGKQVDDIFDDGSCPHVPRFRLGNPVTQVYRAETHPQPLEKSEILLGAIHRTSERNRHLETDDQNESKYSEPQIKHDYLDKQQIRDNWQQIVEPNTPDMWNRITTPKNGYDGERTCQSKLEIETEKTRLRSLSENLQSVAGYFLEPLDISFDEDKMVEEWDHEHHHQHLDRDESCNSRCENRANGSHHIPTTDDVNTFLKSFDSATSMVFHGRTGLPLTSSPAPLRRGKGKFDFDSDISSPHDIKRALFQSQYAQVVAKKDIEKDERRRRPSQKLLSASAPATMASTNLLCNFEESVLNGRLEPVSTVEGFTAEIGASGSFHPKHTVLPVTVFFYTLCDNATVSSPYLGHINLGKKGYRVPQKGTIQVTLFNPLGTVVKMFVVMYDLSDMPPNSQTFLRQRTLYMPSDLSEANSVDAQKWLRYLVHLRFASSKSGKVYLHTDIRMIIFRKSDLDTATDHSPGKGYELRSFTKGPTNPKFSPRR